jgi:hypothetical protein
MRSKPSSCAEVQSFNQVSSCSKLWHRQWIFTRLSEFVMLWTDFSILVWCTILFLLNCKYVSLDSIHVESIRSSDCDIIQLEVLPINSQKMCTVLTVFNVNLQILMLFYFLDKFWRIMASQLKKSRLLVNIFICLFNVNPSIFSDFLIPEASSYWYLVKLPIAGHYCTRQRQGAAPLSQTNRFQSNRSFIPFH